MIYFLSLIYLFQLQATNSWAEMKFNSQACITNRIEIPIPSDVSVNYLRIHPSGNYLLYTDSSTQFSNILEIKKQRDQYVIKNYETPMMEEAFPVEPNWDLISSPYHSDGTMKYFYFQDLISKPKDQIKEVHSSLFNEFYHSIGGEGSRFSVLRWNFLGTKDFEVTKKNNKISVTESAVPYLMCSNLFNLPKEFKNIKEFLNNGMLLIQGILAGNGPELDELADLADKIVAQDFLKRGINVNNGDLDEEIMEQYWNESEQLYQKYELEFLNSEVKKGTITRSDLDNYIKVFKIFFGDDNKKTKSKNEKKETTFFDELDQYVLTKPILSKDAQYVSGLYEGESRVYRINKDKSCTEIASLGADVSKTTFSYPETFKNPLVAFYVEDENADQKLTIFVFDPVSKITYKVAQTEANTDAGYPGFTKDGRLIYVSDSKIVISTLKKDAAGELDRNCLNRQ